MKYILDILNLDILNSIEILELGLRIYFTEDTIIFSYSSSSYELSNIYKLLFNNNISIPKFYSYEAPNFRFFNFIQTIPNENMTVRGQYLIIHPKYGFIFF